MANNQFIIPQGTTFPFDVSVYGYSNITGYNSYFAIYNDNDVSILQRWGTVKDASGTLHFDVTNIDSSMSKNKYSFCIYMLKDSSIFRLVKDSVEIN